MKKHLPAITDQEKRVAAALHFHEMASTSAAQMAIAAAKCGLELKAIKKDLGHGAFEQWFGAHLDRDGFRLRTAQKYMALADGLKGKVIKNAPGAFLELLDSAPSKLSEQQQRSLTKAVSKMTDGATLTELYRDFGIAKKPQGSGATGGKKDSKPEATAPTPPPPTPSTIPAGWDVQAHDLNSLLVEALTDGWWNDCTEERRRELLGNLTDAATQISATLKK